MDCQSAVNMASKVLIVRQYEEHVNQKRHARPLRFTEIERANHFVNIAIGGFLVEVLVC